MLRTDKILIIPDVHGRTFWKSAVDDFDGDTIVFLGDYLDPYTHQEGITEDDALDNFRNILDFANSSYKNVVMILGNHDVHYLPSLSYTYKCRASVKNYNEIQKLILDNIDKFKIAEKIEVGGDVVLFTHAGICQGWFDYMSPIYNEHWQRKLDIDVLNECLNDDELMQQVLWTIGFSRGGRLPYGSPIWADWNSDHLFSNTINVNNALDVDYQVFGHTRYHNNWNKTNITLHCAMLDGSRAFVMRDKNNIEEFEDEL